MHNKKSIQDFVKILSNKLPNLKVLELEPMRKHTTFKIGGPADLYVEPSLEEMVPLIALIKKYDLPFTILGNGSNVLVSDEGIEGIVVSVGKQMNKVNIRGNEIVAQAGAMLTSVAMKAADKGLTGLEFAYGIPGTVGGAVYMNAGAYGGQMKDVVKSALILTEEGKVKSLTVDELCLSYRHSILMKNKGLVMEVTMGLESGNKDEIKDKMAELKAARIEKQPLDFPSAGSTFKRPEGYFAGKLIEEAGLRGYSIGDAQVSEKHCGFVVNKGEATCRQVLQLMLDVDNLVYQNSGVHLEPEVRIIGRNI
ncbi:MAG: UDP-N-acetylmuramate dehydrogenase [Pseudobutyrivibrio sp.]|nr:UDP-N-acetylmuramate dehydrogenase [Pseudobutyrivibrio sp.]